MPHLVASVLAGAAFALAPAVPAVAAPGPTVVRLTLTFPESDTSAARSVVLFCEPPRGGHPAAARACAELARSGGRFERAEPFPTVCTLEYAPVVAEAEGTWRGRPVMFRREYPNQCALRAYTGTVFTF
ncbi:SSI family serine proteinase inhibitor [Actinomadura kijaniata]|uniref:SSI family serine proteinase inhibitor n=1 Tax=Actinomadura kijaniata TaxID=46161 RepID=UPI0008318228|nr:SSI family serine proteinase inhibitor [Actinomadura kijaniata]